MKPSAILTRLKRVKKSSRILSASSPKVRNSTLEKAAQLLLEKQDLVLKANQEDLAKLDRQSLITSAFRDRLLLNPPRIQQMATSLRQVANLSDPIGEAVEERRLQNGLLLKKVRSPLGVIFMIFESRPNVAVEAFSLALKSGNAILLKGGKESSKTTGILYHILEEACVFAGLSRDSFWGIEDPNRQITSLLLRESQYIDVVVPRGGDRLIKYVTEKSRIPVIKNDRGLCHVFVHKDADLNMASQIVVNAKTQRPGVCNAMETLLVHEGIASAFLPLIHIATKNFKVEWRTCPISKKILKGKELVIQATSKDWDREYLDFRINCKVVKSIEEAIEHIELHGSKHSEAIVTQSKEDARKFQSEVDAAVVYWNASTRFTDGFEFGLGGELGISTQKLHVRGPVGLRELTSARWIADGNGQIRS